DPHRRSQGGRGRRSVEQPSRAFDGAERGAHRGLSRDGQRDERDRPNDLCESTEDLAVDQPYYRLRERHQKQAVPSGQGGGPDPVRGYRSPKRPGSRLAHEPRNRYGAEGYKRMHSGQGQRHGGAERAYGFGPVGRREDQVEYVAA